MTTIAEAKAVKERHSAELLALPNVTALGVGPKGREVGKIAVKVFVLRKVPLESLAEDERIPEVIEGIPTDVEVLAPLKAR